MRNKSIVIGYSSNAATSHSGTSDLCLPVYLAGMLILAVIAETAEVKGAGTE